jgi:gamma-glutamylaminecyclotransferase
LINVNFLACELKSPPTEPHYGDGYARRAGANVPYVFVYGTLMRAGANHGVLRRLGATFVGTGVTRQPRLLVDLGPYPAILPTTGAETTRVAGEVWDVAEAALPDLDAFEGCPELFTRERIAVLLESASTSTDGRPLDAFTYVLAGPPPPHVPPISTGRYCKPGASLPEGAAPDPIAAPDVPKRRTNR